MESFVYLNEERFRRICDIRDRRLEQPTTSTHRLQAICDQIHPSDIQQSFNENHGYHRDCHQRFIMNLNRLKSAQQSGSSDERRHSTRVPTGDKVLFEPTCIFCYQYGRKKVKKGNAWTSEGMSVFDIGGRETIIKLAEEKGDEDLARRVRGFNLFSKEALYHRTCRQNYTLPSVWHSKDADAKERAQKRQEAHDTCFSKICEFIEKK